MFPDTEEAKVIIALGASATVFAVTIAAALSISPSPPKWLIYALLSTALLMLGVDYLRG